MPSIKYCSDFPSSLFLDDKISTNPLQSANLFANFFNSNFSVHPNSLPPSDFSDISSIIHFGSLSLNDSDILDAIGSLTDSCKEDRDCFSHFFLKNCSSTICYPLKLIFNLSLKSGIFPDSLKSATITPIFKKGDKSNIKNYRPISKLSAVSKIFESIIKSKLSFIVKNVISPHQHGFVKNRSTITNLAVFTKFCHDSFVNHSQIDVIYTDFSKAFDKVCHKSLIAKLSVIGFHSSFLSWIESYLSNRTCRVVIDGYSSTAFTPSSGVPQGSILGPLLFNLFINDIKHIFNYSKFLLFADDLKLFSRVNNALDMALLQADIDSLLCWCNNNNLQLNIDKCHFMSIVKHQPIFSFSYHINYISLTKVYQFRDLGIVFNNKFTFEDHVNYIVLKAYSALAFIKRNSDGFRDPHTNKFLFTAFVRSILEYGAFIWNPSTITLSARIERVQRAFTRYALYPTFINKYLHPVYNSRCLLLGIKSLESRRASLPLMFIFNIISGDIDCIDLLAAIKFIVPVRSLRSSNIFHIPPSRTVYAYNEPIARSLNLLNTLSHHHLIDFAISRQSFKHIIINLL